MVLDNPTRSLHRTVVALVHTDRVCTGRNTQPEASRKIDYRRHDAYPSTSVGMVNSGRRTETPSSSLAILAFRQNPMAFGFSHKVAGVAQDYYKTDIYAAATPK